MASHPDGTVSVSRTITASPQAIFRAFVSAEAMAAWRPPKGMRARMLAFEPRTGGGYRMALDYLDHDHAAPGKTSEHSDVVEVRFAELVPGRRIVEEAVFESDDPAFAGTMTLVTTLVQVEGGTEVTMRAENAPEGIDPGDHEQGIRSSLANLAALLE